MFTMICWSNQYLFIYLSPQTLNLMANNVETCHLCKYSLFLKSGLLPQAYSFSLSSIFYARIKDTISFPSSHPAAGRKHAMFMNLCKDNNDVCSLLAQK